jgi:hypothetical protein
VERSKRRGYGSAKKNDKWWLTLDETKDDLKSAPVFKYDRAYLGPRKEVNERPP